MPKKSNPVALLIDGDNVSHLLVPRLLNEVRKYGEPIIREVFFNKNSLGQWDTAIGEFSLTAKYVPNNTPRKNAADIALVIRAMQLLYMRKDLAAFCIVSSDSDFADLAKHIVAEGRFVLGIGESKAPESFRNACSEFVCVEDLLEIETLVQQPDDILNQDDSDASAPTHIFEQLFIQAYEQACAIAPQDMGGWVQLTEIKNRMTDLDIEYQYTRKFAEKVKSIAASYPDGIVEVDERLDSKPVLHIIRISDCDIFKFIEACEHAPVKQRDGWVYLSLLGEELIRKYPSYKNGFTYHSIRSKKLLKVVTEMLKDYERVIEVHEERDGNFVVHLVRVNL